MSLLQYFCPTNEKHSNDETFPSPAGSFSTFSLSFNTFYSDSSCKLFRIKKEMKRSARYPYRLILTPTQQYQVGKRANLALKETSVHIMPVIKCSYNSHHAAISLSRRHMEEAIRQSILPQII